MNGGHSVGVCDCTVQLCQKSGGGCRLQIVEKAILHRPQSRHRLATVVGTMPEPKNTPTQMAAPASDCVDSIDSIRNSEMASKGRLRSAVQKHTENEAAIAEGEASRAMLMLKTTSQSARTELRRTDDV